MMQRVIFLITFIFLLAACDSDSSKNSSKEEQEILNSKIDYSTVDVYPLFKECNNCDSYDKQNVCFENEITKRLESIINNKKFKATKVLVDTIYVDLLVDNKGKTSMLSIDIPDHIVKYFPDLDSIIKDGVDELPRFTQPSLKRGIPVDSQFKLPIIIRIKE